MSIQCSWGLSFNLFKFNCQSDCDTNLNILKEEKQAQNLYQQHFQNLTIPTQSFNYFQKQNQQKKRQHNRDEQIFSSSSRITNLNNDRRRYNFSEKQFNKNITTHRKSQRVSILPYISEQESVFSHKNIYCYPISSDKNKSILLNNKIVDANHKYYRQNLTTNMSDCCEINKTKTNRYHRESHINHLQNQNICQQLYFVKPSKNIVIANQQKQIPTINSRQRIRQVNSLIGTQNDIHSTVIIHHNYKQHNPQLPIQQVFRRIKTQPNSNSLNK